MASTPPKPSKQLGELLQDQQDPFILEAFLSERGCPKKGSSSKGNSKRFLKKSASCCLNNSRKGFPARCSKILRAVYKKFVSIKDQDQREKISENRNEEEEESDRFSSASSTTVFVSCSESDKEEISTSLCKDHTSDALNLCNIREKEVETLLFQLPSSFFNLLCSNSMPINPFKIIDFSMVTHKVNRLQQVESLMHQY